MSEKRIKESLIRKQGVKPPTTVPRPQVTPGGRSTESPELQRDSTRLVDWFAARKRGQDIEFERIQRTLGDPDSQFTDEDHVIWGIWHIQPAVATDPMFYIIPKGNRGWLWHQRQEVSRVGWEALNLASQRPFHQ